MHYAENQKRPVQYTGFKRFYNDHVQQIVLGLGTTAVGTFLFGHTHPRAIPVALALEAGALGITYVELRDPTPFPPARELPIKSTWDLTQRHMPRC
jgi:hypothetical protein